MLEKLKTRVKTFAKDRNVRNAYIEWRLARLMGRTPIVAMPNGANVVAPDRFNDYFAIWRQHPSEEELRLFDSLVPPASVVFDVGANYGLYTVMAARSGRVDRLIAFEPIHRYCSVWHKNVELNQVRNATLYQCAVSDSGGVAGFTLELTTPLNNKFVAPGAASSGKTTQVSTVALDSVADQLAIERIHLLKIDVEGAEVKVLHGARRLLSERRIDAIFIEFIIEFMEAQGDDPSAVFDEVEGMGYEWHSINANGSVGPSLTKSQAIDGRRVADDAPERDFEGLNLIVKRRP